MKLVTYELEGKQSFGAVIGDGIVDVGARNEAGCGSVLEVLQTGSLSKVEKMTSGAGTDADLADIGYLLPIPRPPKLLCIGVNYANRNEEYRDGSDLPRFPSMFFRTPGSFVGHGEDIIRPPESGQLDYEGEIVLIIGKGGRRIPKENALDHIAGMTLMNEGTLRDWIRHAKFNVTQGKNFEKSGAIGPWMVTPDETGGFDGLHLTTRVNGEVRQDDTTDSIIFDFPYLINYISTFAELEPGDVISTGTPTGAGARFDPPKWLVPGDIVEIEVPGIGVLSNGVADEKV